MKKLPLVLIVVACLPALAGAQVVEEIITRVNNQIITRSEYQRSMDQLKDEVKQQNPPDPGKVLADREKDVLRDLIDQQLLLEKGKDLGINGDTDLIKALDEMRKEMKLETLEDLEKEATKQGISWEDFKQARRNQLITQKVIGEEVGGHLSISKDEAQAFYDQHKNEMEQQESIQLSEILVAPKTAASIAQPAPAPDPTAPPSAAPAPRQPVTKRRARPPKPQLSPQPRPRPTICLNKFAVAHLSKMLPRKILMVRPLPMAACSAVSSAANLRKSWKTRPSP